MRKLVCVALFVAVAGIMVGCSVFSVRPTGPADQKALAVKILGKPVTLILINRYAAPILKATVIGSVPLTSEIPNTGYWRVACELENSFIFVTVTTKSFQAGEKVEVCIVKYTSSENDAIEESWLILPQTKPQPR